MFIAVCAATEIEILMDYFITLIRPWGLKFYMKLIHRERKVGSRSVDRP